MAVLLISKVRYKLWFSTIERIRYDMNNANESYFFKPNLIILPEITKENIEAAVQKIVKSGEYRLLSDKSH